MAKHLSGRRRTLAIACCLSLSAACTGGDDRDDEVRQLRAVVDATHPHDAGAYTQGLVFHEGGFYESLGQYGESALRRVDLESGEILDEEPLADDLFGEGLALVDDQLVQLTWREGRALTYARADLAPGPEHRYEGEGWGLCFDGTRLWMSDGTSRVQQRDPQTFELVDSVTVTAGREPVDALNELECTDDGIYANVYQTEMIVRFDPDTGQVDAEIDARGLLSAEQADGADVLNGIAHDPDTGRFWLTGKLWPVLFEVRFEAAQP